ncbi:hypothetical protein Tco_0831720 [Tanacetum coccineum]
MFTRAMAKELGAASAHECLFVDFLSEEEPKKVSSRTSWHYISSLIFISPSAKALVISISLDVSVKSVRSSFPRVILIGSISVEVLVTPEVGAAAVRSNLRDDSESDTEMPERHVSPTPHDAMLTRWRSRVASRSSSPTTSTPEIPTAPILPAPSAIVAPSSEFPLAPIVAPPEIYRR